MSVKTVPESGAGSQTKVRAARVRREFGVRGEIAVSPLGGDLTRFTPGLILALEGGSDVVTVKAARPGPHDEVILAVEEFSNPEDAAVLRGKYLCVDQSERRTLGSDEWFVDDLIGLRAVDGGGADFGKVVAVDEYPAHSMLVVETATGEELIPLVPAFVEAVDLPAGVIRVTPWKWESES
jgi:16S rRNA processing protein RimM